MGECEVTSKNYFDKCSTLGLAGYVEVDGNKYSVADLLKTDDSPYNVWHVSDSVAKNAFAKCMGDDVLVSAKSLKCQDEYFEAKKGFLKAVDTQLAKHAFAIAMHSDNIEVLKSNKNLPQSSEEVWGFLESRYQSLHVYDYSRSHYYGKSYYADEYPCLDNFDLGKTLMFEVVPTSPEKNATIVTYCAAEAVLPFKAVHSAIQRTISEMSKNKTRENL